MARRHLGGARAPPERASRRLPRGARAARWTPLSELREPRRDRAPRRRARDACSLAARSRRRATLPRRCALALSRRAPAAHGGGGRLCAATPPDGGDRTDWTAGVARDQPRE